jgi:hypothetical protein
MQKREAESYALEQPTPGSVATFAERGRGAVLGRLGEQVGLEVGEQFA